MPKKKIYLGVTDFALPVPRKGSIDIHSGFGGAEALGMKFHQLIQQEKSLADPTYQAEVRIAHAFSTENYIFEISGKMDGTYQHEPFKIEEIKTSFTIQELARYLESTANEHPYCLQLRTYGYFYWLKNHNIPQLNLHLVSTRNGKTQDLEINLDVASYESWLAQRLQELILEVKQTEKMLKRRKLSAKTLTFPYHEPRKGQAELIERIKEGMQEKTPMLIQAPTGLGKTIGVLYPVLQEALTRGQKIIYLTPKNSQHAVAEDAVQRLQKADKKIKSLTLTAKSKMCFKSQVLCKAEYCEFAQDHYTKVAAHKLPEYLAKKRILTPAVIKKIASVYQVCPFELQFEAIKTKEVVICDYNYVFAPRAGLQRLIYNGLVEKSKPNLIIDEIHNLPARGMEYYSPTLSTSIFEKMLSSIEAVDGRFKETYAEVVKECISIIKQCNPTGKNIRSKIEPPVILFIQHEEKIKALLATYLNSDVIIQADDTVIQLSNYWSTFTEALEFINVGRNEFFTSYHPYPPTIKITCCNAADLLKLAYVDFSQIIGFSATLKPFDYYRQLTGLASKLPKTIEFESPFPRSKKKMLIIPQISSKYSDRERNYPRIAITIQKISALQPGNYLVFFPSFEFLQRTLAVFAAPAGFTILEQTKGMLKDDIRQVLNLLADQRQAYILFAVQGGVFSEGVDYPGAMAIGAFIVGPPLPTFDFEREKMKEYYQTYYSEGFDYAYTYPAMAKAIQAAGRVIRSETDKGIIVLMDNRFMHLNYTKCMPKDWFDHDPNEVVSKEILHDIRQFWTS